MRYSWASRWDLRTPRAPPPPIGPEQLRTLVNPRPGVAGPQKGPGEDSAPVRPSCLAGISKFVLLASDLRTIAHFTPFAFNRDGGCIFSNIGSPFVESSQNQLVEA